MTFEIGDRVIINYDKLNPVHIGKFDGIIVKIDLRMPYPYYVKPHKEKMSTYPWGAQHIRHAGVEHIKTKEDAYAYISSLMRTKK